MLATAWPFSALTATATAQQPYLPSRPSPLSPRSANACPRPQYWGLRATMSSSAGSNTPGSSENENSAVPFSKRDIKANPLVKRARQTPDEARERRRDIFMKKVDRGREEKQWKGRSEQILRSDYMSQRRRWEEARAREAPLFVLEDYEDYDQVEEEVWPHLQNQHRSGDEQMQWPMTPRLVAQPDDEQPLDEMAQMEEEELRAALIAWQEQEAEQAALAAAVEDDMQVHHEIPSSPSRYGSDEEDYDELFMELVSSQQQQHCGQSAYQTQGTTMQPQHDADMMDM